MKNLTILLSSLFLILSLSACNNDQVEEGSKEDEVKQAETNKNESNKGDETMAKEYPQLSTEVAEDEKLVEMETNHGVIKIKLFPTYAPKAVENFLTHAESGYYDGVTFHRVIKDFMIQGGDPNGTGRGGESIWGAPFEDEFSEKLFNLRGSLSMANAGPGTNGSQFFIVQNSEVDASMKSQMEEAGFPEPVINAYLETGGTPWLDFKHTVFGHVVEGMDVVDEISQVEVGMADNPVEPVVINKITVIQ